MDWHKQCAVVLILCSALRIYGEERLGGFEYVFAVPMIIDHGSSHPPHVLITTSSRYPVYTSLTIPGLGFEVNTTITRNEHADIPLPYGALITGPGKYDKTVIVKSSSDVSVTCFDNEHVNGDGFLVLPTSNLGTEYYVVTYVPYQTSYPSFFVVSALGHETSVNFITKAGQEYVINLLPFQTYRFEGSGTEDITGTNIRSTRPVSMTSGVWTRVPVGVRDYDGVLANIPPVEKFGHQFVLSPFMTKSCGYRYRVLSANHTTTLTISNIGTVELQAGEYYEGDVTGQTMVTITSDLPVLVVQYMKGSFACDYYRGDPSMIVVPHMDSYYNNVTFPIFEITYYNTKEYFINVITNCSYVDGLVFDDKIPMADWNQLTTVEQSMCSIRGEVSRGLHSVDSTNPLAKFTVTVYMMAEQASYAYQAGIAYASHKEPPTIPTEVPPVDLSPVSSISGLHLYCEGTNMTAIFNSSVVPFTQASDVHMLDSNCVASNYGVDQAMISTDYNKCQTDVEESDDHILFRNVLILESSDLASPLKPPQVEIECRVERHHLADTNFVSELKKHVSFGNFTYDLDIFLDKTFNISFKEEEYPVDVKFGDNLYLAASVTTVNDLELFVDSCWGTPSTDPWHDTSYSIIHDGCPDDDSVVFFDSGDPSVKQFTFKAFAFKGDSWLVFIHCQLLVCDTNTPNARCVQGCVEQLEGNPQRVRRSKSDYHTVSSGPLVVRG